MRLKLFLIAIVVMALLLSAAPVLAKGGIIWGD
jgi:hypothetical protein